MGQTTGAKWSPTRAFFFLPPLPLPYLLPLILTLLGQTQTIRSFQSSVMRHASCVMSVGVSRGGERGRGDFIQEQQETQRAVIDLRVAG